MNTKFFLLLIAALFVFSTTSPAETAKKEASATIEKSQHEWIAIAGFEPGSPAGFQPTGNDEKEPGQEKKPHKPNSDDDGKHHHFHFNRVECETKRRPFLVFLCKTILTFAHICCLVYCFLHAIHKV